MDGQNLKVAMIGCGRMGVIIAKRLLSIKMLRANQLWLVVKSQGSAAKLRDEFSGFAIKEQEYHGNSDCNAKVSDSISIKIGVEAKSAIEWCNIVFLAVKPFVVEEIIQRHQDLLPSKLLISIAAGIPGDQLGPGPCARVMPSITSAIGMGSTVLWFGPKVTSDQMDLLKCLADALGRPIVVESEKEFDALTALTSCAPAFVLLMIESMAKGGISLGLDSELAIKAAAQVFQGTSELLLHQDKDKGVSLLDYAASLRESVCTPGGYTMKGLSVMLNGNLEETISAAVIIAASQTKNNTK